MIIKLLVGSLLVLTTANAVAGNTTYLSTAKLKILNAELDVEVQSLKNNIKTAQSTLAEQHLENTQKERKMVF